MDLIRRTVLKGAGATGVLAGLLATGMLKPTLAYANEWNAAAFGAKDLDVALKTIGADGAATNPALVMKAPDIAENGAVVPVEVTSKIAGTERIAVIAEKNPFPLTGSFNLGNGAEGYVSFRIKMGQTSNVMALVTAGGKHYVASKEVKVTIGGCGG